MSDFIGTHQRVMNMIARGRLSAIDDANGMQFAQLSLLRGEAKARIERFQQYGFSSVPPIGSEAVCLFVGGGRDHGIIISIDNRKSRIRGQARGEVALYTDEGDYIVLKRGNRMELQSDRLLIRTEVEVVIEAPVVRLRAPVIEVEGNLSVVGTGGTGAAVQFNGNLHVTGDIHASSVWAPGGSVPGPG